MKTITILLIEDNTQDIRLIKEMLKEIRSFDYNLVSAATLKDGCEQIQKNNFDIILLDLNLPDSTGQQTFQKVIDCCKEIPVVLITGNEDQELSVKLIMEGAQDYITKQSLNSSPLEKSILYSIERQILLNNIKLKNAQIDRIEKERMLLAKFPSQNPGPVLRVAGNWKLLYINEAGIKQLPDWQLITNEIIPSRLKDIIDHIFIEGTNIEFELCHRELIYSFYAVPFIEEGYINLYGRDITERKQAEAALRESEEKHRSILQTAMDGFWMVDMQGCLLEVNETYCRMSGYSAQELLTLHISNLEAAELAAHTAAHIQKIKSLGEDRFETRHRRKDGSIFDVEVSVQYQFVDDGQFVVFIQDISERKQAEFELKKSKERYQSFISQISEGVYRFECDQPMDLDLPLEEQIDFFYDHMFMVECNNSLLKMYGIDDQKDIIGKGPMDFHCGRHNLVNRGQVRKFICNGYHIENGITEEFNALGQPMYINNNALGILENNQLVRMWGTQIDITERKRTEEALVKMEKAIYTSGEAIFLTDREGIFTFVNPAFISLYGFSSDEVVGKVTPRIIKSEVLEKSVYDVFWQTLMNGNEVRWELINKKKDKTLIQIESSATPILDEKKNIIGFLGIQRDITERMRMEEALSQSEENFRRSISESPLGIRIVSDDGKTIYANKAFLDIFEFNSLEEFTSTSVINRYTPESYAQHQERKEKRNNGLEVLEYEVSIISQNAEVRHLKVSRKEVLWNGIKHYLVINIDITEQKKLTLDLTEAKEHAEQSDRLKSAFLANMSHEIRTPMNGILGFADLLKEPDLTGEQQQEYIRIIEKSGARMLNIINDIIDISRIESGELRISISSYDIKKKLRHIFDFFVNEAEQKGLQLSYNHTLSITETRIKTDAQKLDAILLNLVKNAIKFTRNGTVEFGCEKLGNYFQFYVKDTGVGIDTEHQVIIFDRFRQASESLSRPYEGAGLGLSISKAYVEMLGGKIWVESEIGKGSVFYFTLPYNMETTEKVSDQKIFVADKGAILRKDIKMLIVEDNDISINYIEIISNVFCKELLKARTGVEAIEIFHKNQDIDLILMDLKMPIMDGYEATRQIRQLNKKVIIIAQTAYSLVGDKEKAIDAGCNDYITKPINKGELLALIQKYFNK